MVVEVFALVSSFDLTADCFSLVFVRSSSALALDEDFTLSTVTPNDDESRDVPVSVDRIRSFPQVD